MSATHGQETDRTELIAEFHQRTFRLFSWAGDFFALLSNPAPDWSAVHEHFTEHYQLSEWLQTNWELLEAFEEPHAQAVEWLERGWGSWHATIAESFAYCPWRKQTQLCVWLGTEKDASHELVIQPGQLDWRQPEFTAVCVINCDESHLNRSREVAWRRMRHSAGISTPTEIQRDERSMFAMIQFGWGDLGHIEPWIHAPHLRSEFAAVRRASSRSLSQRLPTIWSHGGGSYSMEPSAPVVLTDEEDYILQVFLEQKRAMNTRDLANASGVTNVARVTRSLMAKFDRMFAPAGRVPGVEKGSGYFFRVKPAPDA